MAGEIGKEGKKSILIDTSCQFAFFIQINAVKLFGQIRFKIIDFDSF